MGIFDIFKQGAMNKSSPERSLKEVCDILLKKIKTRIITEPVIFAVPVDLADQYEEHLNICNSLNVECVKGVYAHVSTYEYYKGSQLAYFWPDANFEEQPIIFDILHSNGKIVVLQNIKTSELLLQQREGYGYQGVFLPVDKEKTQGAIDSWMEELLLEANAAQTYYDAAERKWVIDYLKIYAGILEREPYMIDDKVSKRATSKYDNKTGNDRKRHWNAVDCSNFKYVQHANGYRSIKTIEKGHKDNDTHPHISDEDAKVLSNTLVTKYTIQRTSKLNPVIPSIHENGSVTFEGTGADRYELKLPNGKIISEQNVNRVVLYRNAGDRFVVEGVFPTFSKIEDRNIIYYDDLDSFVIVVFSGKKRKGNRSFYQASVYSEGELIDSFSNVTNLGVYDVGYYWAESINGINLPCGYVIENGVVTQVYSAPGSCRGDELDEMISRQAQIHKLELIQKNYIKIPLFVNGSKPSVACYQFCKEKADIFEECEGLIPDDDTINCVCWFNKERLDELEFIRYCGQKSGAMMKGSEFRKFLGNGYFKRNANNLSNSFAGLSPSSKAVLRTESDLETTKLIYDNCAEPFDVDDFPESLKFSINQEDVLITLRYILETEESCFSSYDSKKMYEEYYNKAVEDGITQRRWFKEYELFKAFSKIYEDAEFQFRSDWLQKQSLDVYIPSLKIGIEYQGQQHYQAVEFFGGEESYNAQLERDTRKREKCEANNVGLIYWRYDTPIKKKSITEAIEKCKMSGFLEV